MSDQAGEKTEQPTARRMDEAVKHGQFPRSMEIQTVFVLAGALMAFHFSGDDQWRQLAGVLVAILGHLHDLPISMETMQGYTIRFVMVVISCCAPVVLATMVGGILAGCLQSRFQTASEALSPNWEKLNPVSGLKRIFSTRSLPTTGLALSKLSLVVLLSYSTVRQTLDDPIFHTGVDTARIADFMAKASFSIVSRILLALVVIAALDYTYQFWRNKQDMLMTKEEVKDENKNTEGNPQIKARQRRRRNFKTQRQMLMEVPVADVVVTNPTHLAVALRYDRKTMRAPKIVAKGSRLNALRIREIAKQHQVPIIENKPLARLMFKYGKVGGEVPAQLYAAVAEILAYVYRINRYRYYAQNNQSTQ